MSDMDKNLQAAIIQTESSGRPHVEGDIEHPEGKSVGLMQIQENTAKGLYKQGLLPAKWQGKKVKKKNLVNLLKDPEFNKIAGAALFVDNKNRLKKVLQSKKIPYTPEQLNDWTIKAHNQGVTKTIKREVLGQEEPLSSVEAYLNKVKGNIPKDLSTPPGSFDKNMGPIGPTYADGGLASLDPEVPISEQIVEEEKEDKEGITPTEKEISKELGSDKLEQQTIKTDLVSARKADVNPDIPQEAKDPIKAEYDALMGEYRQAVKEKDKAKRLQSLLSISKAISDFGAQYGAGRAAVAGGFQVQAPKSTYKIPTVEQLQKGPSIDDLKAKAALLKHLKDAKSKGMTPRPYQQAGKVTKQGEAVVFDPNIGQYIKPETREIVSSKDLIPSYIKTIKDPLTGEIIEVRPGQGQAGILAGAPKKDFRQVKPEEKINIGWDNLDDVQRKKFTSIEKDYQKDVKESRDFGDILSNIDDLVNADISASIPAIQRQLARSVGKEVGVMTDADVKAFSGDQSLIGALKRFAKLKATGKMTETDKEQYRKIIEITRDNINRVINRKADYHINRFNKIVPYATNTSLRQLFSVEESKPLGSEAQVPSNEVKRRDKRTGKTAIFDKNTQKFLRWE